MNILSSRNHGNTLSASKPLIVAGCLALGLIAQPAQAALTFSFNYLNPGEGFDEPTVGLDRKAALNEAAGMLGAYFSNYTANLTYDVTSYSIDKNTLASAGSGQFVVPGSFQETIVQTKILTNGATDGNGADADGIVDWNFFYNWGLSDNVAADAYDFKKVAIHELLHSFGFAGNINDGGVDNQGAAPGSQGSWATFDNFLTDASGNRLIGTGGVFDSTKVAALTGGSGSVLFNGANAVAANGGLGVNIFAPTTWTGGSSLSHLDDDTTAFAELIMASTVSPGLKTREISAIELGILKDIGYTQIVAPAAVPVPSAVWLMLSGLMGLLGVNRRRSAV
ncbi:PEP-CTERM sorting domain-containing protein [Methylomonas montana]|uniref:PEP-CTERM sorting domain-containing protein n=1 Tax=Methylomonas montana TaxID=3058963 RepID=UPI0026584E5D|nr:PEP-CTERM sorting domain-containing protein [Methylomonas montana]WKJ89891.1 PEP-CTERM sorting domain-containing protein [Methylomonas montana]